MLYYFIHRIHFYGAMRDADPRDANSLLLGSTRNYRFGILAMTLQGPIQ